VQYIALAAISRNMTRAECEPIMGSGAEPPAGSRGRAPGQGARGAKPPEAERKTNFDNTITCLIFR